MERTDDHVPSSGLQRTLPGSAYLDHAAFAAERERIFFREWLCVGRAEALPRPGDFLRVDVHGERVLVVRTKHGGLAGHYDVCRHRGSRLALDVDPRADAEAAPSGRFRGSIVCPYHAWTYALTGELRAAPFLDERDGLRKDALSLHPVGADTWGGFVFVNLTPDEAVPLAEQLGGAPDRVRHYPLEELRTVRRLTYEVAANWKVIVENYNECYHCGPVHPELCDVVPAFKRHGGRDLDWDAGIEHREGATTFTFTGTTDRAPFAGLSEEERTRHKGELVYPNLMISLSPDHVAAFRLSPLDVGRTRIDCDFLFHTSEIGRPSFDPCDAVEFWDLVNRQDWRICEAVQDGMGSRAFEVGYYAPMEDLSLDIRRYVGERLGPAQGHAASARSSTPTASTTSGPR
ncbi:MAG TPA: aromatic ring-hydroxylating dioxygenase subunit alpha [Actinomycetota bacterium]|nr:aromatic ring-hydroxylating dioxygenase subunit alpha [Actinomycetota bacterium]